jgi:hypothetical protein
MTEPTATGRLFGPQFHRVPDLTVTHRLAQHLTEQVGDRWFALVLFGDGRWVARGSEAWIKPQQATLDLMQRAAVALNVQAAEDGHWVVALLPDAREVVALWRDGDGDVHVVVEYDHRVAALHAWTDDQLAGQGAAALNIYRAQAAKVDASPAQMIRRALGETPTAH